jgi:exopolysaccharide production protein ExoY
LYINRWCTDDSAANYRPRNAIKPSTAGVRHTEQSAKPVGGMPKRAVDLVGASIALLLLTPIMLIRVVVGGSAIFAQQRIGFRGKAFVCYKFRTMAVDAEQKLGQHLACNPEAALEWRATRKLRNDPRVTCLGKVLRKSSLDELPQLFNVLRGDMSLVGPRPIVSDEVECYGRQATMYCSARPGLTGMWQTGGRNRVTYRTRIALDRYYVSNWSLWLDLVLLVKTVLVVTRFDQTA